jgi:hypothetical protein
MNVNAKVEHWKLPKTYKLANKPETENLGHRPDEKLDERFMKVAKNLKLRTNVKINN